MDPKERRAVPPGIGPRLPEPEPPAPKFRIAGRENLIIGAAGLLLVALAVWFIAFAIGAGRTPAQAVARVLEEGFTVQEELVQVSLPGEGERSVYFFISSDQLACAVLQRKASGYKVLNVSGHLPLAGGDKPGIWMAPSLGGNEEFFVYGLLYNASAVDVNGNPAVVVNAGPYRCWYYLGEGPLTINSESVVYR